MRDPFDTGPVLRLGEAKAVAPEPEVPAPVTAAVENARPYSFDDVSISIGGMELSLATDEDIKISADDLIDLFTGAFAPRFLSRMIDESCDDFRKRLRDSLIDHGDTSPEALRANHAALVAKKDPQK